ncbi:type I restriction-modification system subunit M [Candidatus Foliamicus sp.]
MALKKSQLYSSLWQSCDELRGGMDASQYKDYVLTLLFMKYVSDKYAGDPNALIEVPTGGGFVDMAKLRGDKEIGDKINKIIARLAEANELKGVIDQADFNDESKLGAGKEMQDRLSKLVAIFEDLNFRANHAAGDDLLGDAYEYLMRHFASESGKSKGQFYTPAEVSRIMARVVGIGADTRQDQTIYDPTCGSGSLLLKAADEAPGGISVYGQEMDNATYSLARMNLILHGHATAEIKRGNTLAAPQFKENQNGSLKTFDFAVANPPFSTKAWSNGLDPENDEYRRFAYGVPPAKNGDYAFLLHLITSLRSGGKGAIILPHGVLFRGNREADIRRKLVERGFIKGVIGLPANLFYGTGIPACILVIDKEHAATRKGIFMIDASRGFTKDGAKNRLREQDIHRIVDVFERQCDEPGYARMVPTTEISAAANDYNLNIPRYIDVSDPEDLHDLDAHLRGGIPERDVDALAAYWDVFPTLREALFTENSRAGYCDTRLETRQIKPAILEHDEFASYKARVADILEEWRATHEPSLREIGRDAHPGRLIKDLSEDLLKRFTDLPLLDPYAVYQRLMDYWGEVMQDDVHLVVADGWQVGRTVRLAVKKETPDFVIKSSKYVGEPVPAALVIARFFHREEKNLLRIQEKVAELKSVREDFEEQHGTEDGALEGLEGKSGITKTNVQKRAIELRDAILQAYPEGSIEHEQAQSITKSTFGNRDWSKGIKDKEALFPEIDTLYDYLGLMKRERDAIRDHKQAQNRLNHSVYSRYVQLTEAEIKTLLIEDKWLASIVAAVEVEVESLTQQLASRIQALEVRYANPLPELEGQVAKLSAKVEEHLRRMGLPT